MNTLVRNWWAMALRGVFAILFGVIALFAPAITLVTLVFLFGGYCFADGVCAILAAFQRRRHVWPLIVRGVIGLGASLVTFTMPGITALALLYVIAAWAVFTGILEIVAAVQLRQALANEVLLSLSGVCSIAFGVLIALRPSSGALALDWLIGSFALLFGVLLLALSVRLHAYKKMLTDDKVKPPKSYYKVLDDAEMHA